MKNVSLKLNDDLHAQLVSLAQRRGAARSDIVREALEAYFANPEKTNGVSCIDRAGDLVGCLSGPIDLATNPKHLRGYGK